MCVMQESTCMSQKLFLFLLQLWILGDTVRQVRMYIGYTSIMWFSHSSIKDITAL